MATVPLIRNKNDVYYRYQMPKLIAKIEGSGNGIRTVVTNMALIAKAINRPGTYVTKFFGYELGAQVKTDQNIYSVNGSHDAEKLLSLLYSFIEKFVLCSSCENPETDLSVSVKKAISLKCKACGSTTQISERTHKLTTFIVNHPPAEDSSKKDSKDSKDSKSGKKKTKKSEDGGKTTGKKSSEHKSDSGAIPSGGGSGGNDDFEDDDFGDDLNPDPNVINNLAEEFKTVKVDSVDCCEKFFQNVKEKADSNQLGAVQIQKDLLNEATNLGIREKSALVLSTALFDENVIEQIKTYRILLLRFCHENEKAQKYLLGGIEKLIETFPKLLTFTAKILKEFYDNDILDENVLIDWYDKPSKKYVPKDFSKSIREKAAPLIKWLKEAEVEDDSDDDNEKRKSPTTTNSNGNKAHPTADNEDDEDDDDDDAGIDFSHRVSGIQVETIKEKKKEDEVDDSFIDAI